MRYTAKGQIEIIGLAFITVIIVIVMLFFLIRPQENDADKKDQVASGISQSFLISVAQSPTDCGPDLSVVLKNCFGEEDLCGGSCSYAGSFIKSRLDSYFAEKGIPYYLSIEKDGQKKIILKSDDGECDEDSEKSGSGILPIADKTSSIFLEVGTCKLR